MKKFLFLISLMFLFIPNILAKEVNVYLFYGEGCSHCAALEEYLDTKDNIKVYKYETWYNSDNKSLLEEISKITGQEAKGVPYYIIGTKTLQGYNDTDSWRKTIDQSIEEAGKEDYTDEVGIYLGNVKKEENKETSNDEETNQVGYTNELCYKEANEKTNKKVKNIIIGIVIIDILAVAIYFYKKYNKKNNKKNKK